MENKRIFLCPPHMGGNEQRYIGEAFEANYIAPLGEQITKFEEAIKAYTGATYTLAVSSCTAALHLALRCAGVKDGDEVFASSFTFIGGIAPILYERAIPFFIDSDEDSWNLDPLLLVEELEKRKKSGIAMPKALVVAHLYGQAAKIDEIAAICEKYGIILLEDSAESLGAFVNEKHTGTFGRAGVFSFNGNKIITSSGGGMLVTDDERLASQARFLATQAKEPFLHYEHETFGYNYRMSNIVAAIGRGQMEVLENHVERHREVFYRYKELFSSVPEISFMPEINHSRGNRWLTTIVLNEKLATQPMDIISALTEQNIESRPLWKPMHMQPVFKNAKRIVNGTSERLFARGLCLPSGSSMSDDDCARVADIVIKTIKK